MKSILSVIMCVFAVLAFASTAQSDNAPGGGEASGTFSFDLGTATGTVNLFGHLNHKDGTASGQITLNATIDVSGEVCQQVPVQSGDNTILVDVCEPTGNTTPTSVTLDFLIDRMVVGDNRAAMSGTIVGDSPFAGQHTILTVEDAGGNDGFTWGVYKTKVVNTNAKDYDFCQGPPDPGVCEGEFCPTPACFCDGTLQCEGEFCTCTPGASVTYAASDYELCPYPPNDDTQNHVPPDPHNYVCYTGAPDPHGHAAGIPVEATLTITDAESFPLFSYPMTPVPNGGGNKISVKTSG